MADEELSKLKIEKPDIPSRQRQTKKGRFVKAAVLAGILLLILALSLSGAFTPAVKVETSTVSLTYPSQSVTVLNASGYVVAQRKAAVASKVTGRLVAISVEEGSRVKKGEILARLENADVTAQKNQAEANVENSRHLVEQAAAELHEARLSFERSRDLLARGYIAKSDFDAAEARYKKAAAAVATAKASVKAGEAALRNAEVNLEYTLIRAPFDAVVLTKNADVGDIVTPLGAAANVQSAVVTIADMSSLQVEADVSESSLSEVRKGQPCEITLEALPNSRFRGEVHMIVPTADRAKATVMVKVRFVDRDARVLPEMSARVAFLSREVRPEDNTPRIAVATKAIVTKGQKRVVFVVREGTAVEIPVSTGGQFGDMTEVLSGVKPGEKIITKPLEKVRNGSKVTIPEGA